MAPVAICATMLAIAFAIGRVTGVDGSRLFLGYLPAGAAITLMSILLWVFVEVAVMAHVNADRPLQAVRQKLPRKLELIVLPGLIFPLFLVGYTMAKTAIPHVVGYGWEAFWADADHLIFGVDPWRITHAYSTRWLTESWGFFYAFGWGAGFAFIPALVAINAQRPFVATFFTAMMLTWFVGGWLMAYGFSAAGPVFAHLVDPVLGARFAPLRESLNLLLADDSTVRMTQGYLASAVDSKIAVRGGGISAMPSMHMGAASIFFLAARGTHWMWPAAVFWLLTLVGSVHFGYHYAVDAPAAAAIALLCWNASTAYFARLQGEKGTQLATVGA